MSNFSIFSIARNAISYHENWQKQWRSPTPQSSYDAIIVGGGSHGLATAYYLAQLHGLRNIAVIEKGGLGGANTAGHTAIVRSNYLSDEASHLHEKSMQLWEGLSQELNYNTLLSQRGVINLGHSLQDMRCIHRRVNANRLNGIDSVVLSPAEIQEIVPFLNLGSSPRYPVMGASYQPRAGLASHDAMTWGFARAADRLGVDIVQNCEVTGFLREDGQVVGVETTQGVIRSAKVGLIATGHAAVLASMAGIRLPLQSHPLQALVSEPLKPFLHTVVVSDTLRANISQSSKGELVIGAGIDAYFGYGQKGSFPVIEHTLQAVCELFPVLRRVRMNRQWTDVVEVTPDACPIISTTDIKGLYLNCGWGAEGFGAAPGSGWVMAHTIANDAPHALNAPFALNRFANGHLIDEFSAADIAD